MTLTLLGPAPRPLQAEDHCPVWEIFLSSDPDHSSPLGFITRFGDLLFEVLEVVAPYDLAYVPTLSAATAYFEVLAHETVLSVVFM